MAMLATLGIAPLAAQGPPEDRGTLTLLRVAVARATFDDIRASDFLGEAFASVAARDSAEVTLCGRFACLGFVPVDSGAGATVAVGVQPARGGQLVPPAADSLPSWVTLAAVDPPPRPTGRWTPIRSA